MGKPILEKGLHIWSDDSIRLFSTPSVTARSAYFYTQEVGYFKTQYPYYSERENLDSFLLVYTIAGHGILQYEGHSYQLEAGKCFWINCQKHHQYRTADNDEWEFRWLHFNGNSAFGYYKEFARTAGPVIAVKEEQVIKDNLQRIIELQRKKNRSTELLVSESITKMLTAILLESATDKDNAFLLSDYIKEIAKEIDGNPSFNYTLDYFADKYHRSKFHLLKEFKKYIGITINEYIITTRIQRSKELLKYTAMSVEEVAEAVGISNATHFINLFKAREQTTPLSYRKTWQY